MNILEATLETIFMSFSALILSYIVAIPLACIMVETTQNGLFPNKIINLMLNRIVDLLRAIPFVLLLVFLFPVTRFLIGTAIGTRAVIFPLTICAIPFVMRMIETSLNMVDKEIVEASKIDGANNIQIIIKIKLASILCSLINGVGIVAINIVGYSTMAGTVGGGGLGNYAIVYGFQRYDWNKIFYSIIVIVLLVVTIQILCNLLVKIVNKK